MEALDDFFRYGGAALLGWLSVLMLRNFCDRLAGKLGALSAASTAFYILGAQGDVFLFGVQAEFLFLPISSVSAVLTWLFCLTQFDDNFRIEAVHKWVVAVKLLAGLATYPVMMMGYDGVVDALTTFSRLIILGVVVHLIIVTWQGRHDDLVEDRRKVRSIFTISVVAVSIAILVMDSTSQWSAYTPYWDVIQSLSFAAIAIFLLWRLADPAGVDLFYAEPKPSEVVRATELHCELSATDQHDLNIIKAFTRSDGILEAGLTISKLSRSVNIPEHRLRHLINQHLGYRNFADFVNHHRIEAAKQKLADMDNRNIPVLTLAMDLGYGSLGPFNRAFKERTGLTPTEFRAQSMEAGLVAAK